MEAICRHATQGMLDNVRSAKSARQILLNQYDELGMHSGKMVNLLELGINTIDDEIVVHPWAQSILDEQWCGRDVHCGKVMFKTVPDFLPLLLQA